MTQNLKIEVLTGDISIDGMVVTNLVTKEELSTAIVKKADLGTDGKIPTSQLPAEIVNTAGIVDEVKLQLETSIKDAVDESNAYAESYTDNVLSSKADLTSGKVPLEQLPSIDQYPQFGTALSNLSTSILTSVKQRTDQLEKTKADLGEDGKVLREQIPSYEKISGLPEQLEVMSTQTAAVSGELDEHKLQTADQIYTLKENIEANVQQLTDRQSHLMRTYATKELGVDAKVGVKPGEYFYVRSPDEDDMLVEYQNVGGVPTLSGKAYPSSEYVARLSSYVAIPVRTVADLLQIENPKDGMLVYLKSYHLPDLFIELNPFKGGGNLIWEAASTATANGGTVFQIPGVATGRWIRLDVTQVTVEMFGTKGNGTYDDRPAFQAAVDYLHGRGGGELVIPKSLSGYRWKSYDSGNSACLVIPASLRGIYVDPISLRGAANLTDIKVDLGANVTIEAAVLLKGGGLYRKFENLCIWGGKNKDTPNCNYVVKGKDAYYPNLTMRDCQFYVANEDCVRLATYVSVFDKVQTAYSKRGIKIAGPGINDSGPVTSLTFNSCYGLNHTHNAFWLGETTYCTFNACAADHIIAASGQTEDAYPYYIDIARGVSMNGCGAESSTRILKVRAAQGFTVNGLMTLSIGNAANQPNELIRIDGGYSATFSGIWNQNPLGAKYILSVGKVFETESVMILDDSITPSQVQVSSNWKNARPVRFLWSDYSRKTYDYTLTNTGNATTNATNLADLAQRGWDTELLHDNIIRFPSGDFEIDGMVSLVNAYTRGSGRVRLIGHEDGTSRLIATGAGGLNFGLPTCLSTINFAVENLELRIGAITGTSKAFHFYRSVTTFTNGKITSDNGARQYYAVSDATLRLDATSALSTPMYDNGVVEFTYKATSAPTNSVRLPVGTIFKASDPNIARIGWINTNGNGVSWTPIVVGEPSGTTAQRPTGVAIGYQYFDTTIGKPIYWKGSNWVDAIGSNV